MAVFPRIQNPCPYSARLSTIMDGDYCRMCRRTVHDLTDMTDGERRVFMSGCTGEVCVSYRTIRPAFAAAALAATAAAIPAAAAEHDSMVVIVTGGGITDPANTVFVDESELAETPDLPVVYEKSDTTESGSRATPDPAGRR